MIREFIITLNLPSWARWYAVDADGSVYIYRYDPYLNLDELDIWFSYGEMHKIMTIEDMAGIDWTKTLHEIERAE